MDDTSLHAALLEQPQHVLFPASGQLSHGFGEAGWRAAMLASNEHLIPRDLTLGFCAPQGGREDPDGLLEALLNSLRLHASVVAGDREVGAMVLQLGMAEHLPPPLLGRLLDAVPHHLSTIARPQVEVRLDAASGIAPGALREVGCTRLTVIDHAGADGPAVLAQGLHAGFTACYYQLRIPARDDLSFLQRLQAVLASAPDRLLLPAPCVLPSQPAAAHWLQAWRMVRAAGYRPIGGDHYQRPDLTLPVRNGDGQRYCDLLGVPRRKRHDLLGIGPGASSQIGNVMCEIESQPQRWRQCLAAGQPGVAAGLILSGQECLVDEVVQSLACDHALDMRAFEWRNTVPFEEFFKDAMARVPSFIQCGWLQREGHVLRIQHEGELLWRTIAACFRPSTASA
ncbi:coproporphyrinogen III oxidase [Stenotrophomonas pictorum JCM 9942]|uniref:Coproporphyrinogen III oxidase n=1 Tax=Stenotrophomonas pictorum JCM 9942 TaxID=1236960 RepID=A0A0R0AQJ7_9GAMM|nr:hypothetical protein [Stenotrophomonas pictorum]KRG43966.1 coproporphyrinogen III oxidase [Stenotrophomonas pictorum JCM 9942]